MKQMHENSQELLITPSLLNSWQYIWDCEKNVVEAKSDDICLEDKKDIARSKAYDEFIKTLYREPIPMNDYMKAGIEWEDASCRGETIISPLIEGGAFQIVGKKHIEIMGFKILMYGRLDVLKAGTIIDIKKVVRYSPQKYITSHQHPFYLKLFPSAQDFVYLIYDGKNVHEERYTREECENIVELIGTFIKWLQNNNLIEIYKEKWKSKGGK